MKIIILGLIAILAISCSEKPKAVFLLNGTTDGIDSGTVLYLENISNKEFLDSVIVEKNSFNFKTKLPKTPLQVLLRTKNFSHYRFLWLENNEMTFDGAKTDFRNAVVTGSESEDLAQKLNKETDTLSENEVQKLEMKFVDNYPNSIVSANMLSLYSTTWGKEKTKELFEQFSVENKTSEYGNKIAKYIELNKVIKVGGQYVDFEMNDSNGNSIKLSDLKRKTILLEFWASWCGPCRQENPNLVKTYEEFNSKGFEVFAVSLDEDKDSWLKAIEKDSLNWKHVSDLKGRENEASLIYGVNGIPDNFLINQNGVIVARNLRGEKLNKKLEELIKLH